MADLSKRARRWLIVGLAGTTVAIVAAVAIWRDDILRTSLDPKVPFQTYQPPLKPDYARRAAWSLLPTQPDRWTAADPPADIFFVSPTTYDGGSEWNARINDPRSDRYFRRSIAPNYAAPFLRAGRIFGPRYRQASLYTLLTLREDAREARRFAYGDVAVAFRLYRDRYNQGRPFVLVGVEQGGLLASRLLVEQIMPDPAMRGRLAAAYLIETVTPAAAAHPSACVSPAQTGCVAAWATKVAGDYDRGQDLVERALVWGPNGQLESLGARTPLCFNPVLHATTERAAAVRQNLGAANATGLEWGARPAFLTRQVSAQCRNGVLRVSRPKSALLRPAGSWADRRKVASYNLFWLDLETDAKTRVAALLAGPAFPRPAPPITRQVEVGPAPIHPID